jgi:hypothetical protein
MVISACFESQPGVRDMSVHECHPLTPSRAQELPPLPPPPRGEVASAADGAPVDRCSWCHREGLCVCPHCDANLCGYHFWTTDCPGCLRAVKRRRLSGKQSDGVGTPVKAVVGTPVKADDPIVPQACPSEAVVGTPVKADDQIVPQTPVKEQSNDEGECETPGSRGRRGGGWLHCQHPSCK